MFDAHARLALAVLLGLLHGVLWAALRGGRRARARGAEPVLTEASSALLALLGLLLAFTVSMAVSRFEARKQLVIDEANAIGTAALRTQLLPEPFASQSAEALRAYAAGRVRWGDAARDAAVELQQVRADAALQARLWSLAIAAGESRRDPEHALYVAALNDAIDLQNARVHQRLNRVPETVLGLLAAVALLAIGVAGAVHGRNGARRGADLHAVAVAVWLVIALIVDLDQPRRGWIRVSQAPLAELAAALNAR